MSPVESALLTGVGPDDPRPDRKQDNADDNGAEFGATLSSVAAPPPAPPDHRTQHPTATPSAKEPSSSTENPPARTADAGTTTATATTTTATPAAAAVTTATTTSSAPAAKGAAAAPAVAPGTAGLTAAADAVVGERNEQASDPDDEGATHDGAGGGPGATRGAPADGLDLSPPGTPAVPTPADAGPGVPPWSGEAGSGRATAPATATTTTVAADPAGPSGAAPASDDSVLVAVPSQTSLSSFVNGRGAVASPSPVHSAAPSPTSATDTTSAVVGGRAMGAGPATLSPTVAVPAGSAPVTSVSPTPVPGGSTPASNAAPTPAQQIVTVLTPLQSSEDGTHEVTIGPEPEGLGTVKATVTVSAGQVVVQLGTDNAAARDALRQALPQLRQELAGDGSSASVLLSNNHQPGRQAFAHAMATSKAGASDDDDADDPLTTTTPVAVARAGHVDLHL